MADEGGRRIRPVLWIIVGASVLAVGLLMALDAAATATRIGAAQNAPLCTTDFAEGCITERTAVLDHQGYTRMSWITAEQRWLIQVPDGAPDLEGNELLDVTVPRQEGREGLTEGAAVTVVYFGRSPAWIYLPAGAMLETAMLETEDHPICKAPLLGWLSLAAIGGGIFAVRTAIRSGRGGNWLRRVPARVLFGLEAVLLLAGALGAISHTIVGGSIWPGIIAGGFAAGIGLVALRESRRRRATAA